jgi:hypothetical protein
MSEKLRINRRTDVFLVPSFYGVAAWVSALLLLHLQIVKTNPLSSISLLIFLYTIACLSLSTIIFLPYYRRVNLTKGVTGRYVFVLVLLLLHAVGFIGIGLYVSQLTGIFGSLQLIMHNLTSDALLLRAASSRASLTVGTQLSYFGWLAIFLTVPLLSSLSVPKTIRMLCLGLSVLQFSGNLVWADRTRPIWIIFVLLLLWAPNLLHTPKKLIALIGMVPVLLVAIFLGYTSFTGKFNKSVGMLDSLIWYSVGGLCYFDDLLNVGVEGDGVPQRTFYPIFKAFAKFDDSFEPPSQILEPRFVPYSMNVGTFLEPLLSDGGLLMLVLGIPILVFTLDSIGLVAWRNGSSLIMGRTLWANLCFTFAISFFVPKYVTLVIYIYVFAFVLEFLLRRRVHS